jgi:hypothetical protein
VVSDVADGDEPAVLGFGMAVTEAPLTTVVMDSVGQDRTGTASGSNDIAAEVKPIAIPLSHPARLLPVCQCGVSRSQNTGWHRGNFRCGHKWR